MFILNIYISILTINQINIFGNILYNIWIKLNIHFLLYLQLNE